jgi:hypothetical protein
MYFSSGHFLPSSTRMLLLYAARFLSPADTNVHTATNDQTPEKLLSPNKTIIPHPLLKTPHAAQIP